MSRNRHGTVTEPSRNRHGTVTEPFFRYYSVTERENPGPIAKTFAMTSRTTFWVKKGIWNRRVLALTVFCEVFQVGAGCRVVVT
jgi:hypothetical protein